MILRWATSVWALVFWGIILIAILAWGFLKASQGQRRHWIRRAVLVLMVILICMTPSVPSGFKQEVNNIEVFFVLDRSISMMALDQDGDHPRMERATEDIKELAKDLPGSRYAAITFASQSQSALPLTTDAHAVKSWADTVVVENSIYASGSSVESVSETLYKELSKAKERHPANIRLVFLLSDGENTIDPNELNSYDETVSWDLIKPLVDGGLVLGYGTEAGGKMRETSDLADGDTEAAKRAPFIKDPQTGKDAISHEDPDHLRKIAEQLGIKFEQRSGRPNFTDDIKAMTEKAEQAAVEDNRSQVSIYRDFVWPFVWVAVAMAVWEFVYLGSRFRRLREDKRR